MTEGVDETGLRTVRHVGDLEDGTLERVGDVQVPVAVERHRIGDPGIVPERDRVHALVALDHVAMGRCSDRRHDRDIFDRGGAVEIRRDALDFRLHAGDTGEVADVEDVDFLVRAIEFQAEQRRESELARGEQAATAVVPQQHVPVAAVKIRDVDIPVGGVGGDPFREPHREHGKRVHVAVDEQLERAVVVREDRARGHADREKQRNCQSCEILLHVPS